MKHLALFSARSDRLSPAIALLRRAISAVVIVFMALNLVVGSFSGYVHAHEHSHDHHHHHDGGDHHDHGALPHGDDIDLADQDRLGSSGDDSSAQLHEHGANVVIAFVEPASWTAASLRPLWRPDGPDDHVTGSRDTSERPPRVA